MREAYTDQLERIFTELVDLACRVRTAVHDATEALLTASVETAERVISNDAQIDAARERIEDHSFALLSLQQPVAGDLRTIVAALRMVVEFERMGDLAAHVAKIARMRVPDLAVPESAVPIVQRMAEGVEGMVAAVGEILEHRDVEAAKELPRSDEEIDALRRDSFRALLSDDWTHGVEAAVDLALLGRYYERIADHAVSVAGRVVFVVTGEQPTEVI